MLYQCELNKQNEAKFIVIEGLEGAGKSTIIKRIQKIFEGSRIKAVFTREPGGTLLSEKMRDFFLKSHKGEILCSKAELLLVYAMRIQHIEKLIKPSLRDNKWVICDRFYWSSLAYQGGGRELGFRQVQSLNNILLGSFSPHLTIYLDVDPIVGLKRIHLRNKREDKLDRIEQETMAFFRRARKIFIALAENNPKTSFLINANVSLEEVQEQVEALFSNVFSCFSPKIGVSCKGPL